MPVVQWPPWEVSSLREKLDDLTALVQAPPHPDPMVLGVMSRMLVIRASGYIEQSAKAIARAHVEQRSGGRVRTFALTWLEWSRNPTPDHLTELVGRFDANFRDELLELLEKDDQRLLRELSLLVDRRNKIAHGLNEGVTRDKAVALANVAIEVTDWLVLRFNPV
jgi:hypothetical protein